MYAQAESTGLDEYMAEIREQVCSRCIERPRKGPPCLPQGKVCGIELHLGKIVELVHAVHSASMDPYIAQFHAEVCAYCPSRDSDQCPCPLDSLLLLAIEAIERVDQRRES